MKYMMFIKLTSLSIVFLHFVTCDFISNQQYYRTPLVLNKWPPRQNSYRNSGLIVQLRPSGPNNIISRVASPAYFIKDLETQFPLRSRFHNIPIKSMLYQSTQKIIIPNGPPKLISSRPIHITRPFKPVNNLEKQNEYMYEKLNLQKIHKTIETNDSAEAIHTVTAPNLTIEYNKNMNKNININDFEKLKPLDRQVHHQYQVRERSHDLTDINQHDRLKKQNFNEFSQSSTFYPSNNIVSENDDKEFQSNHKQVLDLAVAASLVQLPTNPQYVLEQKSILPHANAYNPSYLVMQSKNLLSKYQKFWNGQFKPENGFIDSFFTQKPNQIIQPFIYTKPKFAYTIAQISTSNQHSTTISPITFNKSNILQNNYENLPSEINSITISSKLVDENPSYKIQFASDIDVSKQQPQQDEQNQVKEFHNQMDAGTYHGHQLKNDLILKEAEQNLQKKKYQQQQREHSTLDLQKQAIVEQFKDSILRIVVAEESQLKLSKKS